MRIFLPVNSNRARYGERGFIFLDALLCLFISVLLFLFLELYGAAALRASQKLLDRSWHLVASRDHTSGSAVFAEIDTEELYNDED
jgi:hypothetical protein